MAYEYDVFVSYRRKSRDWVCEYFLPLFEYHLQEAVGGRAISIFVDTEDIEAGDAWPQRLHHALAHSKCLVPAIPATLGVFTKRTRTRYLLVKTPSAAGNGQLAFGSKFCSPRSYRTAEIAPRFSPRTALFYPKTLPSRRKNSISYP